MSDDRVVPVGEVERAIRADLGVHRAEVLVRRAEDRLDFGNLQPGAVFADLVVEEAAEADRVEDDEVALHRLGEVATREELGAADGPRAHVAGLRRLLGLHRREVLLGRERRPVVRLATGRVEDDVAAPLVEDVAVGIREVERDVGFELPRPRLEPVDAAVVLARDRAPRRFDRRAMEDAFLHVERAAAIEREAVDRVVRVGGVEPVQEDFLGVVLVVAVRVLEEDQVRLLCEEHAAVPELEAGRVVQVAREHRALVGLAVAVGVFEDDQLVVHRRLRLPVGIVLPGRDPQPSLGVERHLHRVDQLGELLLGGEELDLQPLADGHRLDGLVTVLETGTLPAGWSSHRRTAACSSRPRSRSDPPAIAQMRLSRLRDHHVEDGQLALQDVVVARQDVFLGDLGHLFGVDVARDCRARTSGTRGRRRSSSRRSRGSAWNQCLSLSTTA